MQMIRPWASEYDEYRRDESRSTGEAESISFPTCEDELRSILSELDPATPITVQGARTGLAGGAVPHGGHVVSLVRMNAYKGLRRAADGAFFLRVEPGVVLSELRRHLHAKSLPAHGWDDASRAALEALYAGPEQFFPTDPTETSACLGGMAACNASGARSYRYGPMRPHVSGLRVVLVSGETLALRRGDVCAQGRALELVTEQGTTMRMELPTYDMPRAKNASGYFIADDMDAVDLFIGSDGTLGIITELELALMPAPRVTWGVNCFFEDEGHALDFVVRARPALDCASAFEYFDGAALDILRTTREDGAAFASLPEVPDAYRACVFVELECDGETQAMEALRELGSLLEEVGRAYGCGPRASTPVPSCCARVREHTHRSQATRDPLYHQTWLRHVCARRAPARCRRPVPAHIGRGRAGIRRVGAHWEQPPAREHLAAGRGRLRRGQGPVPRVGV